MWGIWGYYYHIRKALFHLLKGDPKTLNPIGSRSLLKGEYMM